MNIQDIPFEDEELERQRVASWPLNSMHDGIPVEIVDDKTPNGNKTIPNGSLDDSYDGIPVEIVGEERSSDEKPKASDGSGYGVMDRQRDTLQADTGMKLSKGEALAANLMPGAADYLKTTGSQRLEGLEDLRTMKTHGEIKALREKGLKSTEKIEENKPTFHRAIDASTIGIGGPGVAPVNAYMAERQKLKEQEEREKKIAAQTPEDTYLDRLEDVAVKQAGLNPEAVKKMRSESKDADDFAEKLRVASIDELKGIVGTKKESADRLQKFKAGFWEDVATKTLTNIGYQGKYLVAAAGGALGYGLMGLADAEKRVRGLMENGYDVDEDGNLIVRHTGDDYKAALRGGATGAAWEIGTEIGTDVALSWLLKGAKIPIGKGKTALLAPWLKRGTEAVGKVAEKATEGITKKLGTNAAGRAILGTAKFFSQAAKKTGFNGLPTEQFEEYIQDFGDNVLGFDVKDREHDGVWNETKRYWREKFSTGDYHKDIFLGLIGTMALQGGYAAARAHQENKKWRKDPAGFLKTMLDDKVVDSLSNEEVAALAAFANAPGLTKEKVDDFLEKVKDNAQMTAAITSLKEANTPFFESDENALEEAIASGAIKSKFVPPVRTSWRQGAGDSLNAPGGAEVQEIDWQPHTMKNGRRTMRAYDPNTGIAIDQIGGQSNRLVVTNRDGQRIEVGADESGDAFTKALNVADRMSIHNQLLDAKRPMKQAYVESRIEALFPKGDFHILANNAELLEAYPGIERTRDYTPTNPAFTTEDGKVVIVLDNLKSAREANRMILHEAAIHSGLKKKFTTDEKRNFLRNIDDPKVNGLKERFMEKRGVDSIDDLSDADIEEAFARAWDRRRTDPSLMQKVTHGLREMARAVNLPVSYNTTDLEVMVDTLQREGQDGRGTVEKPKMDTTDHARGVPYNEGQRDFSGDVADVSEPAENTPEKEAVRQMQRIDRIKENHPRMWDYAMRVNDNDEDAAADFIANALAEEGKRGVAGEAEYGFSALEAAAKLERGEDLTPEDLKVLDDHGFTGNVLYTDFGYRKQKNGNWKLVAAPSETTKKENTNEAGHGADEAPAQPEQRVERPSGTEAAGNAPASAEAAQGSVVETGNTAPRDEKELAKRLSTAGVTGETPLDDLAYAPGLKEQFKENADPVTGEVEPLNEKALNRALMPPIIVYEFKEPREVDGKKVKKIVGTGLHRYQAARRAGWKSIPTVTLREEDGFTLDDIEQLDAMSNIIDEKGSVNDYIKFFDRTGVTREEAAESGFLDRPKGRTAFGIYENATADTRATTDFEGAGESGKITPEQAGIIAEAAPKDAHPRNAAVQHILVKRALEGVRGKKLAILARTLAEEVRNRKETPKTEGNTQLDLFTSEEDVALLNMEERRADYRAKKANEYAKTAENLRTALRKGGKLDLNKSYARELGITNPNDKKQIQAVIEKARERANYWENAVRLDDADKAAMDKDLGIETPKQNLTLESPTAEQLTEEERKRREREAVKNGLEKPLKGSGQVNVQPEMDLGQTGQTDLFSPVAEKPTADENAMALAKAAPEKPKSPSQKPQERTEAAGWEKMRPKSETRPEAVSDANTGKGNDAVWKDSAGTEHKIPGYVAADSESVKTGARVVIRTDDGAIHIGKVEEADENSVKISSYSEDGDESTATFPRSAVVGVRKNDIIKGREEEKESSAAEGRIAKTIALRKRGLSAEASKRKGDAKVTDKSSKKNDIAVSAGYIKTSDVKSLFDRLNTDPDSANLANKVFRVAKRLNVDFYFDNFGSDESDVYGFEMGGTVFYNADAFSNSEIGSQEKANVLLHEAIHSVTTYAIDIVNGQSEKLANIPISKELRDAVSELETVYDETNYWLKRRRKTNYAQTYEINDSVKKEIGDAEGINRATKYSRMAEFLAELSNDDVRRELQSHNLWTRLVNGIRKVINSILSMLDDVKPLGSVKTDRNVDALTISYDVLDKFLRNADVNAISAENKYLYEDKVSRFSNHRDGLSDSAKSYSRFNGKSATSDLSEEGKKQYDDVVRRYTNPDGTKKPGWMKAPNGKPTRLTERQWVQVRTQAFKEWFGDWENAARRLLVNAAKVSNVAHGAFRKIGNMSVQQTAIEMLKTPIVHKTEIGDITIDKRSAHDSLAHRYSQKKLDALVTLQQDFANAVYLGSERDFDGKDQTNHYFAYPISYGENGERNLVFCRAREDINANRLYVHEVFLESELKNNGDALQTAAASSKKDASHTDASPNANPRGIALARIILKQLFENKGVSKVVDENGEPLVVYHDTNSKRYVNRETGEDWDLLTPEQRDEWEDRDDWDDYWEEQDFWTFDNRNSRNGIEMPAHFFSPTPDPYHEYGERRIAAFLNIRNPAIDPVIPHRERDTAGADAMNALRTQGHDGFIRTEDGKVIEINAFDPNQIKSATDNNGDFSGDNDDILWFSREFDDVEDSIYLGGNAHIGYFSSPELDPGKRAEEVNTHLKRYLASQEATKTLNNPTPKDIMDAAEGKWSKFRRAVQDKNLVIREVEDRLGITDKKQSVYYAKDREFGLNEYQLMALQKRYVEPIFERLAKTGAGQEAFDLYLIARHAPARNSVVKARTGQDNGSGMSDEDAAAVIEKFRRLGLEEEFSEIAEMVYAMNDEALQRRVDSGRITQEMADDLQATLVDYVPLRTDMENAERESHNVYSSGFHRSEFRTAQGRETMADSPLAWSIVQAERSIKDSNANDVRRVAAELVRHSQNIGKPIGEIIDGKRFRKRWAFDIDDEVWTMDELKDRPNLIFFKEDGRLKAISINEGEHSLGNTFAKAITDKDLVQFSGRLQYLPKIKSFMAGMRTQFVPTFIIRNFKADTLEVIPNMLGERGMTETVKFMGRKLVNQLKDLKAVGAFFRGKEPTGRMKEYVENGGLTGGGLRAEGFTETMKDIQTKMSRAQKKGADKFVSKIFTSIPNAISFLNAVSEYSTRVGVYSTLRDEGMSIEDAISYARDITVDFNRKGYLTPITNFAFLFSNAKIQGQERTLRSIGGEHGYQVITYSLLLGALSFLLKRLFGNDDDREKKGLSNAKNLSEHEKMTNIIIPLPGGTYFKWQNRSIVNTVSYMAEKILEAVYDETTPGKATKDIISAFANEAASPLGGPGIDTIEHVRQTIIPTLTGRLFYQWSSGKDFLGRDRLRKKYDENLPDSWNGKYNTPEAAKWLSKTLNAMTGGNKFKQGKWDTAPENWMLLADYLFGGVGTDLGRGVTTIQNAYLAAKGAKPDMTLRDMPFIRDTITNFPDVSGRFMDALDSYKADMTEYKGLTDWNERRAYYLEHPWVASEEAKELVKNIKDLQKYEQGYEKSGQRWIPRETTPAQALAYRRWRLAKEAQFVKIMETKPKKR